MNMVELNIGNLTDTQRLDAIGFYGLTIVRHHVRDDNSQWTTSWVCTHSIGEIVQAATIREAIDIAVADAKKIEARNMLTIKELHHGV